MGHNIASWELSKATTIETEEKGLICVLRALNDLRLAKMINLACKESWRESSRSGRVHCKR